MHHSAAPRPKADTGADDTTPVTITFWHGLSSPHEIASVNAVLARFHKKYPYITVKAVAAQTDDTGQPGHPRRHRARRGVLVQRRERRRLVFQWSVPST
ncbi:hypothetical protein ACRAWF_26055 [Streptomyces sp. L7]